MTPTPDTSGPVLTAEMALHEKLCALVDLCCTSPNYVSKIGDLRNEIEAFIAVSRQRPTEQCAVAWGLFADVGGKMQLQHPVRFSRESAESDKAMYEKHVALDVRALYAAQRQEPGL